MSGATYEQIQKNINCDMAAYQFHVANSMSQQQQSQQLLTLYDLRSPWICATMQQALAMEEEDVLEGSNRRAGHPHYPLARNISPMGNSVSPKQLCEFMLSHVCSATGFGSDDELCSLSALSHMLLPHDSLFQHLTVVTYPSILVLVPSLLGTMGYSFHAWECSFYSLSLWWLISSVERTRQGEKVRAAFLGSRTA